MEKFLFQRRFLLRRFLFKANRSIISEFTTFLHALDHVQSDTQRILFYSLLKSERIFQLSISTFLLFLSDFEPYTDIYSAFIL